MNIIALEGDERTVRKEDYMKKSFVTRVKAAVMALIFAATVFTVGDFEVNAAAQVKLGQIYRPNPKANNLGGEAESYTFTAPANGYFKVDTRLMMCKSYLGGNKTQGSTSVKLEADNKLLWNYAISTGGGEVYSPRFALAAGQTVTLTYGCESDELGYDYAFKIDAAYPENFEKENNDKAKNANAVQIKKVYNGLINGGIGDCDWYVFKAPKTGNYKFTVSNTETENVPCFVQFEGYKTKTKADKKNLGNLTRGTSKTSKKINLRKGKKYFIKISTTQGSDVPYTIRFKKVK